MASDMHEIIEQGVATLSDKVWELARLRAEIIRPLAALEVVGHQAADAAAEALGLSRRQVYALIRRAQQDSGLVTDLAPGKSSGGKGKGRLSEPVERIIRELLQKRFLTKQKRSLAAFHREIVQACKTQKLRVPARNTVARRIAELHPAKVARSRGGQDAARPLQGAGGTPPEVTVPLKQVQIDHTVIDLIVVDERDRQPIGRPYLTIAIDVFTRCVLGMVVTLEAPSAVSVGLCLAHAACDKRPWLEGLDVEMDWPMRGKPKLLYLDNAAEFKSEALRRGCEQHGIQLDYRPPGQPHYGGIAERIIGTAMQMIHDELPGTTFSNPGQRGEYDSEKKATLTLRELERWLALAVGTYHAAVYGSLFQPPTARWAEAVARVGVPAVLTRATAFLVDFLPVIRRTLTRTGFVIDHIHYYADALKPWIARRNHLPTFMIRRDPRDISRIWVLEPEGQHYLEIPYRTLSHPAVSLWEQRQALAKLRQQGREQVDESTLFRMIGQMREIVTTAQKATRKARRDADRRQHLKASASSIKPAPPDADSADPQAGRQPVTGQTVRPDRGVVAMDEFPIIDLSHLLPAAQGLARLPANERIQRLRADRWIGYPRAVEALNRLETLYAWPNKQRMPNLLLVGLTNNGKSMIIEKFRRTHPASSDENQEHIPVLVVQMPSEPSVIRFYVALLAAMGAPLRPLPRLPEMEQLALALLRKVGVHMLVIEELHNVLAGNSVNRREFLNLLRFLGNELRIPLVGVGTREAYLAIRSDDQLENRFEPMLLPVWEANDDCCSLLASFATSLPLRRPSSIATLDMARYLLTRSEGTIGELANLLMTAAVAAVESGEEAINHRTLSMADYTGPSERRRQFERELM